MKEDRRVPNLLAQVGTQETKLFCGIAKIGFEFDSTQKCFQMQGKNCNRCGRHAAKRGRVSAAVTLPNGRPTRRYLCARCVGELQSGARLAA